MVSGAKSRIRLEDVAAEAGVSLSTASKVINGKPGLASETRSRVERAAIAVGYAQPNRSPESSPRVVVVMDSLENPHSIRVLEGLISAGQDAGIEVVVHAVRIRRTPEKVYPLDATWVREMVDRGHTAVVAVTTKLNPSFLAACVRSKLSIVAIDAVNPLDASVVSVGSTDWMGGFQATRHLTDLGHRRIGFVAGDRNNVALLQRLAGYREALATAGIAWDAELVSEEGMDTAETSVATMLDLVDPPTAFFASFDAAAFQAIRVIEMRGLSVPQDVSVVGYDDAFADVLSLPKLSTIRVPYFELGEMALDLLARMHEGMTPRTSHVQLSTSLVVRETTGLAQERVGLRDA